MNDISSYQDDSSVFEPEDIYSEMEIAVEGSALEDVTETVESVGAVAVSSPIAVAVSDERLDNAMALIDNELVRLASREVLPAHEVTDLLLDLRLQLVGATEISDS